MSFRTRARTAITGLPHRAIAQSGGLAVGTGISRLGSLVAAVIVARTLGPADLGQYAAAIAIGGIIVGGPGSGLPIMVIRDFAAGQAGRSFALRSVETELIVTGLATVLATFVTMAVIGGSRGAQLGFVVGVGDMALVQQTLATSFGLGLKRYRLVVALQSAQGVMFAVLTFVAVRTGLGVLGAVAGLALSGVPCALVGFCALRQQISKLPDRIDTHRLFWRSKSFLGLGAVNGGYQRSDSVITLAVAGAATAGVYASAYRLLGPFDLIEAGFAQVFYPRLSSVKPGSREWANIRRRGTRLYCLVVLPPAVLAIAIMPVVLGGLFGPSFHSAVTPARILMLSLVPGALYWPDALALAASGREASVLYLLLIGTLIDVALVAVLAGRLGAAGAAWAWVATETSLCLGVRLAIRADRNRAPALPD